MTNFDTSKRLISLDMLRGLTIALMIVVNDPGSWGHLFWPLAHAEWHGITLTDFVYPFFIFIIGVSIVLSSSKVLAAGKSKNYLRKKIFIRSLKIFALGIFLNLFPDFDFVNLRIPGVLQRIAIVYFVCANLYLITGWKMQLKIAIGTLIGYWLIMILIPVPEIGAGFLEPGKNLAAWLDSVLMPGRMYQVTWDPEGLLTTIPAIISGVSGMLVGYLLKMERSIEQKLNYLFFIGVVCILLGYTMDLFFPMNKNLWSSSYVLFTSGWAMVCFAASIMVIDVYGYDRISRFGVIYGSNSIAIYVLAGMLPVLLEGVFGLQSLFFNGLVDVGLAPKLASALWAFVYMYICFVPAYILYKKKIFIKV